MLCFWLFQGGIYVLELVDYSVSGFPLLVVGFLECGCLCWVYGYQNFADDIEMMLGKKPSIYWQVCWKGLTPLIISVSYCYLYVWYVVSFNLLIRWTKKPRICIFIFISSLLGYVPSIYWHIC